MKPKELLQQWVDTFNKGDAKALAEMYADNAINHQVNNKAIEGKDEIYKMFEYEFNHYEMVCIVENLFEYGDWGMLEWRDPLGLRGCGFFQFKNDKIIFQRGYWDKLTFLKQHNLPIE